MGRILDENLFRLLVTTGEQWPHTDETKLVEVAEYYMRYAETLRAQVTNARPNIDKLSTFTSVAVATHREKLTNPRTGLLERIEKDAWGAEQLARYLASCAKIIDNLKKDMERQLKLLETAITDLEAWMRVQQPQLSDEVKLGLRMDRVDRTRENLAALHVSAIKTLLGFDDRI